MTTPTTLELTANIIASIEASIGQAVPLLPRSFIAVLAKALAAVIVILYKRGDFIGMQWFVKTASTKVTTFNGIEFVPLIEIGRQIGVSDPGEATQAELQVDITVENQIGQLDAGTQIIGATNGVVYLLLASVLLDAPIVQGVFRAASDQFGGDGSGVQGNLDPGDTSLQFANPLPNVARGVLVDAQVVTGAEGEPLDTTYRQRVLDRFQKRPQGGAYADYKEWAMEAPGIISAFPYTGDPGQVNVYTEATVESSGSADGIPTVAQLQAVLDLINFDSAGLANRRNVNAFPNSLPITRTGFDITVAGITGVDSLADTRAEVEEDVNEYYRGVSPFIVGLSVSPRNDQITRTRLSAIVEDIVTAAGGTFTSATFALTLSPGALESYILGEGEKAKATSVVFV